jgi:hypothetical protein
VGALAVMGRAGVCFSQPGDGCACLRCGGDSMPRSYALSPLLLVAGRPASSFEATRVMGGSCGGKGEMGELDT